MQRIGLIGQQQFKIGEWGKSHGAWGLSRPGFKDLKSLKFLRSGLNGGICNFEC